MQFPYWICDLHTAIGKKNFSFMTGFDVLLLYTPWSSQVWHGAREWDHVCLPRKETNGGVPPGRHVVNNVFFFRSSFRPMRYVGHSCAQILLDLTPLVRCQGCVSPVAPPRQIRKGTPMAITPCRQSPHCRKARQASAYDLRRSGYSSILCFGLQVFSFLHGTHWRPMASGGQ
jgi:hypothetical protein